MPEAQSTIALGVQTAEALTNLQRLKAELAEVKSAFATLDAVSGAASIGSGMMRGVAEIVNEVKKLNTQFDDMTARMAKVQHAGENTGKGLASELKKAVEAFIETGKGAEDVIALTNDLTGSVTKTGKAIGNMKAEAKAATDGLTKSLQQQLSDTELLARAEAALALKTRERAAAAQALANSPEGKRQLEEAEQYRRTQIEMMIADTDRAEQAKANATIMMMAEVERREQALQTANVMMMAEVDRVEQAKKTANVMMMAEIDRREESRRTANVMMMAEIDRAEEARKSANVMMMAEIDRREEALKTANVMMMAEVDRREQGMKTANVMMMAEIDRAEQAKKTANIMMMAEIDRREEATKTANVMMMAELDRAEEAKRTANIMMMAETDRNEQLRIAKLNTDFLTASEKERLAVVKRAAEFSNQQGVTPRMVEVHFGTEAASMANAAGIAALQAAADTASTSVGRLNQSLSNNSAANRLSREETLATAKAMSEAHSSVRGLAGGLNMLWLTWGSTVPLVAGAAITATLRGIYEEGKAVEHQLMFVKALSDTRGEKVDAPDLESVVEGTGIKLIDAANGLRTLKQAGLDTNEALMSLRATMTMSVVGELPMGQAAETLTGALKAFNLGAEQSERVSDVIVRAAASSNASVGDMAQAFKYAAPAAVQYGISLEEVGAQIALLSERNIRGSMAGTTFVNLMNSLRAPTAQASKTLEKLGFDFRALQNEGKTSIEMLEILRDKLANLDPGSKASAIKNFTDVRGSRELNVMLSGGIEKAKEFQKTLEESKGFGAQAMLELQNTVEASSARMHNALAGAFTHAFMEASGPLQRFQDTMAAAFRSESFRNFIDQMATGLVNLTRALRDHADTIGIVIGVYAGFKIVTSVTALLNSLVTSIGRQVTAIYQSTTAYAVNQQAQWANMTATQRQIALTEAHTVALEVNAVANNTAQARQVLTTGAVNGGGTALGRLVGFLGTATTGIGIIISVLGTAYTLWEMFGKGVDKAADAHDRFLNGINNTLSALDQEIARLEKINRLRQEGKDPNDAANNRKQTVQDELDKAESYRDRLLAGKRVKGTFSDSIEYKDENGDTLRASVDEYYKRINDANTLVENAKKKLVQVDITNAKELSLTIVGTIKKAGEEIDRSYMLAAKNAKTVAEQTKLAAGYENAKKALDEGGNAAQSVAEAERRAREAQTIFEKSKNTVSFDTPKGNPDALINVEKRSIIEEFRSREKLAKMQYDAEIKLADDALAHKLISDLQYYQTTAAAKDKYEGERKGAYKDAEKGINKLETKAEKETTKASLEQSLKHIQNTERETQAQARLNEQYKIQSELNKVLGDERKLRDVEIPAESAKEDRARNLKLEAYGVTLLEAAERNLATAKIDTTEKYQKQIDAMNTEIALNKVNLDMAQEAANNTGLPEGDRDLASKAAAAESRKLEARQRMLKLLQDQQTREVSLNVENAKHINAQQHWNQQLEKSVSLAGRLESAFGRAGKAVGGMTTALVRGLAEQQAIEEKRNAATKQAMENGDVAALQKANNDYARESAEAQIRNYGDLAGAAKGFFNEQSKGYKALHAMEAVFRAFELASAMQSFIVKSGLMEALLGVQATTTATGMTITEGMTDAEIISAGLRQAAEAEVAVARTAASIPFPFNIAAAAAVAAALGVAFSGGSSINAKDRQDKQSTGTVLGSENAKSESIDNAISHIKDNSFIELTKQQEMIGHLIGIKDGIRAMTHTLVAIPGIRGTAADLLAGNFGKTNSSGILGTVLNGILPGILTKTKTLLDSGIMQDSGQFTTVGSMRSGSYDGLKGYQDIETKRKLLGFITYNTSNDRNFFDLEDGFKRQVGLVISQMGDTLVQAGSNLGMSATDLKNTLDGIGITFGSLSLKGMSADEAEKALSERFSQIGDILAKDLFGTWALQYQKAGEGLAETVIRVADDVMTARYQLDKLGISMMELRDIADKTGDVAAQLVKGSIVKAETTGYRDISTGSTFAHVPELTGVGKIMQSLNGSASDLIDTYKQLKDAQDLVRQTLGSTAADIFGADAIKGAGGLDKFSSGINAYKKEFFSEDQQKGMGLSALQREFDKFNLGTVPKTREAFVALVNSMAVGSEAWGKLISLAGDFADVVDKTKNSMKSLKEVMDDQTSYVDKLVAATQKMMDLMNNSRKLVRDITKSLDETVNYDDAINQQKSILYSTNDSIEHQYAAAQELYSLIQDKYQTEIDKTKEVIDLYKKITDYADGLLTGDKSPLTNSAKLQSAQGQYQDLLTRARAGDKDAAGKLTGAADTYLEIARTMFASGDQYKQIFNSVYSSLQGLGISGAGGAKETLEQLQKDQKAELVALRTKTQEIADKAEIAYNEHLKVLKEQLIIEQEQNISLGNLYVMNDRLRDMPGLMANELATSMARLVQVVIPQQVDGSHAGGLDYVPFDGYIARLHKGERVLTSAENGNIANAVAVLTERMNTLIEEQRQQTEALIKAAFASAKMSSEKVVDGTKEAVENSEWKKKAKVEVV